MKRLIESACDGFTGSFRLMLVLVRELSVGLVRTVGGVVQAFAHHETIDPRQARRH